MSEATRQKFHTNDKATLMLDLRELDFLSQAIEHERGRCKTRETKSKECRPAGIYQKQT